MLSELYIENVAVIEKVCVGFHQGFNVFTGETGAGKSMLINSINSIMGKRTYKDIIRNGTKSAIIIAGFTNFSGDTSAYISNLGIKPDDDGNLILERDLNISGRTSCKINSKPCNTSLMKDLSDIIINIHGQNDNYDLLSKNVHIQYVDALADNQALLNKYKALFKKLIALRSQIKELSLDEEEKLRQTDLLTYQINEIEAACLADGEIEKLREKQRIYSNSEKTAHILSEINTIADGSENQTGLPEILDKAAAEFQKLTDYLPEASDVSSRLNSACYEIKDCLSEISDLGLSIIYEPSELEAIEERLDIIYRLCSKYGETIADILDYANDCKKRLENISSSGELKEKLKAEYKKGLEELKIYAAEISDKRKKASELFSRRVKEELSFLNMPNTDFVVSIQKSPLSITGGDDVQFLISANAGEPLKPLNKIASGGELSRIMLSIKSVLADKEHIPTLIFDEIDSGISGQAAQKVGLKLKQLSKYCQVICITHLAQIACFADKHFLIEKNTEKGRTFTEVKSLDYEGKKREIARIISGNANSKTAADSAEEMLKTANDMIKGEI